MDETTRPVPDEGGTVEDAVGIETPAGAGKSRDDRLGEVLALADNAEEQGGPLTRSDHIQLFIVGVAIPLIILVGGWLIYG